MQRHFSLLFRNGDGEAFTKAYRAFLKPIRNYVSGKLRDQHAAEEITQDIFLKAYRFRESFDPQYEFSTWIWTIARNTLSDWFRKNRQNIALDDEASKLALHPDDIPCLDLDAESVLIQNVDRRILMRTMATLAGLQRKALSLRLVHQLPYHEIAKRLNLSLSSVKCLVHRAKSTLIKRLEENAAVALEPAGA